jgi:hypothetical protein
MGLPFGDQQLEAVFELKNMIEPALFERDGDAGFVPAFTPSEMVGQRAGELLQFRDFSGRRLAAARKDHILIGAHP